MEHVIEADRSGIVRALAAAPGDTVAEGQPLVWLEEAEVASGAGDAALAVDLARIRADLAEVVERHALGFDERRPDAVARRRKTGQRTARENVDDLCDPGSFIEYGPLAIAAQRRRRTLEDLIAAHARRRPGRRDRQRERRRVRGRPRALRGARLRLHRARGHAGHPEPPQEGPPVRARGAVAAAGRDLHRGRRRPARRHRRHRRRGPRLHDLPRLRRAVRASCRSWRSTRAAASRATRRCSAAATS